MFLILLSQLELSKVEGDNIDAIYDKVKQIIIDHSTKTIWVASNENF